jgi:hypothetical protein
MWAVLLLFHAAPDTADIYESLRDDPQTWIAVHVGTLAFIGLTALVLAALVHDITGAAARLARLALLPFVLFYGAGEAILGIATGVVVEYANGVPRAERPGAAGAAQALWDDAIAAELLPTLGSVAWVIAVIAAALALYRAGAPRMVPILLVVSSFVLLHAPPIGPAGLVCLAAAVAIVGRRRFGQAGSANAPTAGARRSPRSPLVSDSP